MTATLKARPIRSASTRNSSFRIDAQKEDVKTITAEEKWSGSFKSRNDARLTINTGYLLHGPLPIASFSTIFEEFSQSRRRIV